jgi:hypothetical protein
MFHAEQKKTHEVELQRFPDGAPYTIEFDGNGKILRASMYVKEKDVDVTHSVKNSPYWCRRIAAIAAARAEDAKEDKYFQQGKEAANE